MSEPTPAHAQRDDFADLCTRVDAGARIREAIDAAPGLLVPQLERDLRQVAHLLEHGTDDFNADLPRPATDALTAFARSIVGPAPERREWVAP